jgi:hypothetical protein
MVIMTIALTIAFALILITAYAQEIPATINIAVRKLHEAEIETAGQFVARGISTPRAYVREDRDCGLYPAVEDEVIDVTGEIEIIPSDDEINPNRMIDAFLLRMEIQRFLDKNMEEVLQEVLQAGKAEMALWR